MITPTIERLSTETSLACYITAGFMLGIIIPIIFHFNLSVMLTGICALGFLIGMAFFSVFFFRDFYIQIKMKGKSDLQ